MDIGASKPPFILAYSRDEEEADATARIVRQAMSTGIASKGGTLKILASTPSPLLSAPPTGIIWDLHAASVPALTALVHAECNAGRTVPPVLGRVDLAGVGERQLIQLAILIPCLRLFASGADDFEDDIIDWLRFPDRPTAEHSIIKRLATTPLTSRVRLAIKAAVAAKRRVHVQAFATTIGIPLRTIEGRLSAEGPLETWRLVGWSVSLHALWRLEVRQWSLKHVAISLGFNSAAALGSHLKRHVGERPRVLLAHHSFESILDEYVRRLASRMNGSAGA